MIPDQPLPVPPRSWDFDDDMSPEEFIIGDIIQRWDGDVESCRRALKAALVNVLVRGEALGPADAGAKADVMIERNEVSVSYNPTWGALMFHAIEHEDGCTCHEDEDGDDG